VDNRKIKAAVVSVSDTRREEDDISGGILVELLVSAGADVVERLIVSDDLTGLRETLYTLTEREDVNLIVTTGGTGFAERDNTPEATLMVIEREAPGLAEAMRAATLKNTPFAMLSRGVCGIRNSTLIMNLPGSPKGVEECFEVVRPVLQHAVNMISGSTKH
jgi:molybdenum cofactor synthesis domain-containing protein